MKKGNKVGKLFQVVVCSLLAAMLGVAALWILKIRERNASGFQLAYRCCCKLSQTMQRRHGWLMEGFGTDGLQKIERIHVGFFAPTAMSLDEGREALMGACEEFLAEVHRSERLHAYLLHNHSQLNDIAVNIVIQAPPSVGSLTYCGIHDGILCFSCAVDRDSQSVVDSQETWEEAVARRKVWRATQSRQ